MILTLKTLDKIDFNNKTYKTVVFGQNTRDTS